MRPLGLRIKLIAWISIIIIILLLMLAALVLVLQQRSAAGVSDALAEGVGKVRLDTLAGTRQALEDKREGLAKLSVGLATTMLLIEDNDGLDSLCELVDKDPDVIWVCVLGKDGKPRSSYAGLKFHTRASAAGMADKAKPAELLAKLPEIPGLVSTRLPIAQDGTALGSVVVVTSDERLHKQEEATTARFNEMVGRIDGVIETSRQRTVLGYGMVSFLGLGITILAVAVLVSAVIRQLMHVSAALAGLAAGDLTKRATVASRDEVGVMAGTLNTTMDGLRGIVGGINQNAQGIAEAAKAFTSVSNRLTGNAETAASQAHQAAAAAAEVSASIGTFASGVEEMGSSVGEIAKNASQAATVAKEGVAVAAEANTAMTRLGTSSTEIGDIVKVITGIAEQTNLLALNATIEAARAGDAGRGFAVVASEVKDLARKTSEATTDIGKRVAGIQGDSQAAQDALRRISDIVGKINELQSSIAAAVEEQSATTKELAGNISQVAQAGTDIAKNVNLVAGAAKEAASGAGETLKAANELANLAAELRQSVARFHT